MKKCLQRLSVRIVAALAAAAGMVDLSAQQAESRDTSRGDRMIAEYFRLETERLERRCLADVKTKEDWDRLKPLYRAQLFDMLGLAPLPERTPLLPTVTATTSHDEFLVERLHFQSQPGLYVTANLYRPKTIPPGEKLPAILYVCGHGRVAKGNVSFGNKVAYQHHGAWFARHGYVCLMIDSLQLGEIEGIHHGTYQYGMWWWPSRGYSPAGVEAWNCIRALDYLQSRPEVDGERLGVTGRSGGGAYSWWIAALDERIRCAVPVAGITDLRNHVVDGTVEGHCDCMFHCNALGWDFAQVAALVSPRPLLISNTDKDPIFPLDGVVRLHAQVRRIYELEGAGKNLGLQITEGGHNDTQELHIHAFHWFNRFLKGGTQPIEKAAVPFFEPEHLKVFEELPADQRNTRIQEQFVPRAGPFAIPRDRAAWHAQQDSWLADLASKTFAGWPAEPPPLDAKPAFRVEREGLRFSAVDFTSQEGIRLRLYSVRRAGLPEPAVRETIVHVLDEEEWERVLSSLAVAFSAELADERPREKNSAGFDHLWAACSKSGTVHLFVAPRGVGPTAWNRSPQKQIQHRRRFLLLGQTLPGMQVWDVRRALQVLRHSEEGKAPNRPAEEGLPRREIVLRGSRAMSTVALYAAIFEPGVTRLELTQLPPSHQVLPAEHAEIPRNDPRGNPPPTEFYNVLRVLDVPQAVALAAEKMPVRLFEVVPMGWEYPQSVGAMLSGDPQRVQFQAAPR